MRPFRVLLFLAALAVAPLLRALEVPPAPTQWFTDGAGLVNDIAAQGLNQKLRDFEQSSGAQFIIYILPSLEGESIEDFTIRCVERWKVGQSKYDNGLVLFVFAAEKKVRIEVGYGLEGTITDAFSSRVIREFLAPHFQKADYAGGLHAAADAIIAKISKNEEPVAPLQPSGSAQGEGQPDINPIFVIAIVFFVFFVLVPMLSGRGRRGRGGCGGCMFPLFFPMGGSGITFGGGGGGFSGFGGGGGGGGFSGGGGGFGGGGATGGW